MMKKFFKPIALVLMLNGLCLTGGIHSARASGIPTVDIAALVQSLVDYSQQLSDYAEQLYQSQVAANQYVRKLEELEQVYREYEHTLEQIKGIKDLVDNEEWEAILAQVDIDFPLDPFDSHWDDWDVDIYTEDGVVDVDDAISASHDRIRDLTEVYDDIDSTFSSPDMVAKKKAEAKRQYMRSRDATDQEYAYRVFKREAENLEVALEILKKERIEHATGSESELRTLQILTMQQELNLFYMKAQNELLIKKLELSNQESIHRKNRESYAYDMNLMDQHKTITKVPYVATDRENTANF